MESVLFAILLSALWLNRNANGISTFLRVPQLINWV